MSSSEAWDEVFPGSAAAKRTKQTMASRFLKWYEATYPATFHEIAAAYDLTPDRMGELIDTAFSAHKWRWDPVQEKHVETAEPDWKVRFAAYDRLIRLMEKDDKWRREFLEKDQEKPTQLNLPREAATFEEFEEWRRKQDIIGEIERKRKEATEARDRAMREQGLEPPPPLSGGTATYNGR